MRLRFAGDDHTRKGVYSALWRGRCAKLCVVPQGRNDPKAEIPVDLNSLPTGYIYSC